MNTRLDPYTILPIGTPVTVNAKRGTVIKAEWARDQFGQPICSHTLKLTHRIKRGHGDK